VARRKPARQPAKTSDFPVGHYRHADKRKNNPPAGLAAQGRVREAPRLQFAYNPQLFRLHDGKGHGEFDITSIVKLYEAGGPGGS
jgi:hypothetical protein